MLWLVHLCILVCLLVPWISCGYLYPYQGALHDMKKQIIVQLQISSTLQSQSYKIHISRYDCMLSYDLTQHPLHECGMNHSLYEQKHRQDIPFHTPWNLTASLLSPTMHPITSTTTHHSIGTLISGIYMLCIQYDDKCEYEIQFIVIDIAHMKWHRNKKWMIFQYQLALHNINTAHITYHSPRNGTHTIASSQNIQIPDILCIRAYDTRSHADEYVTLMLFLWKQFLLGEKSVWSHYIATLPFASHYISSYNHLQHASALPSTFIPHYIMLPGVWNDNDMTMWKDMNIEQDVINAREKQRDIVNMTLSHILSDPDYSHFTSTPPHMIFLNTTITWLMTIIISRARHMPHPTQSHPYAPLNTHARERGHIIRRLLMSDMDGVEDIMWEGEEQYIDRMNSYGGMQLIGRKVRSTSFPTLSLCPILDILPTSYYISYHNITNIWLGSYDKPGRDVIHAQQDRSAITAFVNKGMLPSLSSCSIIFRFSCYPVPLPDNMTSQQQYLWSQIYEVLELTDRSVTREFEMENDIEGLFTDLLFRARLSSYYFLRDPYNSMIPQLLVHYITLHPGYIFSLENDRVAHRILYLHTQSYLNTSSSSSSSSTSTSTFKSKSSPSSQYVSRAITAWNTCSISIWKHVQDLIVTSFQRTKKALESSTSTASHSPATIPVSPNPPRFKSEL